jgi:diguanylate cyclase (GGDEF)-like protein
VGVTEQLSTVPAQAPVRRIDPQASGGAVLDAGKIADILASIGEVPYEWDIRTNMLAVGRGCGSIRRGADRAPATPAAALSLATAALLCSDHAQLRRDAVLRADERDGGDGVLYRLRHRVHADGATKPVWIEDIGRWFAGPDGRPARAHGIMRLIDEPHASENPGSPRLDDLTGEMNRRQFTELLADALHDANRLRASFATLVVSIDDLARVNEAYGFAVGDEVISAVARRLRANLRGGDHLGRLAGNKFGLMLRNCTPHDLRLAGERLLVAVRDEVILTRTGPVAVTVSMGGIMAPRHAETVQELLTRVHEALGAGKLRRRGTLEVFRPNAEREAMRRENMRASDAIVSALNERRIVPAFEPVVEAGSRRPAFHEALMRIGRPDGTNIAASDIMPIAERLGLVRLIDHRMLELVIAELVETPQLTLSVNVSPASIIDGTWWNGLAAALAAHPDLAPRLIVELTESAAIQNLDETRSFVARARDAGCRIAIDDFGTGCTSFRNMRRLGVDLVKIDGGFVANLARSPDDQTFVRMLIGLAKQLGLETVAEWVQDEAAAALLTEWGCDYLQGALIGAASTKRVWQGSTASGNPPQPAAL